MENTETFLKAKHLCISTRHTTPQAAQNQKKSWCPIQKKAISLTLNAKICVPKCPQRRGEKNSFKNS